MKQLPERANLEQLKNKPNPYFKPRGAKDLAHLNGSKRSFGPAKLTPRRHQSALHDAQFVIAREYGFNRGRSCVST